MGSIALRFLEGAPLEGKAADVVILEAGTSLNSGSDGLPRYYSDELIDASAPLFEGQRVFAYGLADGGTFLNHKPTGVQKDLTKDWVGILEDVRAANVPSAKGGGIVRALVGKLKILEAAEWARKLLKEAWQRVGLSIDAEGREEPRTLAGGRRVDAVTALTAVQSVDLVSNPAAGGRVVRLAASADPGPEGGTPMREILSKLLLALAPKASITEATTEDDLILEAEKALSDPPADGKAVGIRVREMRELMTALDALKKSKVADDPNVKSAIAEIEKAIAAMDAGSYGYPAKGTKASVEAPVKAAESKDVAKDTAADALREEVALLKRESGELRIDRMVEAAKLPEAMRAGLKVSLRESAIYDAEAIQRAVSRKLDEFGALVRDGLIQDKGGAKVSLIESGLERLDKMQLALTARIAPDCLTDDERKLMKSAGIEPFRGIREAYEMWTGDRDVRSRRVDMKRVHPEIAAALREAVTTAGFPVALGNTLHRKLVKEYPLLDLDAVKLTNVVDVSDFRTQESVRIGGYSGSLPVVAEGAAYTALPTPTDEEATYVVSKKGGIETVTWETIKNDDVRLVNVIPKRMARLAARTLNQHVVDLLMGWTAAFNDTAIYDAALLYTAAAPHTNLLAVPLTWTNVWAAAVQMSKQAELDSAEPLGVRAKYLVVPPDLKRQALEIVSGDERPDTADRATNTVRSLNLEVMTSHFLHAGTAGSTTRWFLVADPMAYETIELGFLDGQREPELLVQDTPTVDAVFTNDVITYRLRHTYKGAVIDFRSFLASSP